MDEDKKVDDTKTSDAGKDQKEVPSPKVEKEPTEREKAVFNLKRQAERLASLGGDPSEVLASVIKVKPEALSFDDELPDDKPLTYGDLKNIQRSDARKTAIQMAEDITDAAEREATLSELHFVVPSGNAQADLIRARSSANAVRNARIAELGRNNGQPKRTASGGTAPAPVEEEFVPTAEEAAIWKGFRLSPEKMKEKIIEARKRTEAKQS